MSFANFSNSELFRVKLEKSIAIQTFDENISLECDRRAFVRLSPDFSGLLITRGVWSLLMCIKFDEEFVYQGSKRDPRRGRWWKYARNSKTRDIEILKSKNCFLFISKSFSEIFFLLLHNSLESWIYWLFSVAWKCRLWKLFLRILSSSHPLIENIANRKSSLVHVKIHIADAHFERYISLSSFLSSLFIWYLLGEWSDFKRNGSEVSGNKRQSSRTARNDKRDFIISGAIIIALFSGWDYTHSRIWNFFNDKLKWC